MVLDPSPPPLHVRVHKSKKSVCWSARREGQSGSDSESIEILFFNTPVLVLCMYVCIHTPMHVQTHTQTQTHTRTHAYADTKTKAHTHAHMHTNIRTLTKSHTHMYTYILTHLCKKVVEFIYAPPVLRNRVYSRSLFACVSVSYLIYVHIYTYTSLKKGSGVHLRASSAVKVGI